MALQMLEQGVMGIASEVRTAGGPPKLVALVPTPELYGEGDVQVLLASSAASL